MKILVINPHKKHDYLASVIIEGLKKLDIELYYTDQGNGADKIISDDLFIEHYKSCDFIFAIWGKSIYNGVPAPKFHLIDRVNGWNKTAYIDGSEYNYTAFKGRTTELLNPAFFNKCKWYFKRECLPIHVEQGVIPLPFAAVDSDFYKGNNIENKTIDVFCSFGQTDTGLRKVAMKACNELKSESYNIVTDIVSNYFETIQKSYITIDAHGGGECNARAFQIMANKSCLFMEKYNIYIPNLLPGKHYVYWTSKDHLKSVIKHYLNNKEYLNKIIKDSYNNLLEFHTSEKRVKYMLEKMML